MALIFNCLFHKIILNGCAAKPLSTLSWDYSSLKPALLMYVSTTNVAVLIWGGRWRDLMAETYSHALFSSADRTFAVQSSVCASVPMLLVILRILHPSDLYTRSRRTRTWWKISTGSGSLMRKDGDGIIQKTCTLCFKILKYIMMLRFLLLSHYILLPSSQTSL